MQPHRAIAPSLGIQLEGYGQKNITESESELPPRFWVGNFNGYLIENKDKRQ